MSGNSGYVHTAGKCGPNPIFCSHLSTSDCFFSWQSEQHKPHGIWSFQFRFVPLPYVVLTIQVRCFAMWLQSEQTYQNSCDFYVTLDQHLSQICTHGSHFKDFTYPKLRNVVSVTTHNYYNDNSISKAWGLVSKVSKLCSLLSHPCLYFSCCMCIILLASAADHSIN